MRDAGLAERACSHSVALALPRAAAIVAEASVAAAPATWAAELFQTWIGRVARSIFMANVEL